MTGKFGTCALCGAALHTPREGEQEVCDFGRPCAGKTPIGFSGARPVPPGEGIYPSDERRISRARRDREFLKEVTAGSDEEVKW